MVASENELLQLAFAMYHAKGAYALLLGSGMSRAAGILTGWEITRDLIKQVAAAKGETMDGEPEDWYRQSFGEEPRYKLIQTF